MLLGGFQVHPCTVLAVPSFNAITFLCILGCLKNLNLGVDWRG